MKRINSSEALELILENSGKFFSVEFKREKPKCEACNKAFPANKLVCPKCNGPLSTTRKMTCRLGVQNPGEGITKPGTGAPSVSGDFGERIQNYGMVTAYDVNVEGDRTDESKGGYRCFKVNNLITLKVDGEEYLIM